MKISAIILTKNEEKNIAGCIESLTWCNEVLVIDDNSTDKTVEIAKKTGARVFNHALGNNFAKQRNFGLNKANNEWVLFVDTDERVSLSLKKEITQCIYNSTNQYIGFYIKREDYLWGKRLKYGEAGNIWLLRLAKKNAGKWRGKVHETWQVKGSVGKLDNPFSHYPHPSIAEFLKEINFYTSLRAEELYGLNIKANFFSIIFYPKAKFLSNYIFKLGFLDGIPGLLIAILMSFHSFLVRGKLWYLWQKQTQSLQ